MLDFKQFSLTLLCAIFSFSTLLAENNDTNVPQVTSNQIALSQNPILKELFKKWEVHQLDINTVFAQAKAAHAPVLNLKIGAIDFQQSFQKTSLIGSNYLLSGSQAKATHQRAIPLHALTDDSEVALTVNEDFLYGFIKTGAKTRYIEPLWYFIPDAPKNQIIIYDQDDIIENTPKTCGVTEAQKLKTHIDVQAAPEGTLAACHEVDIAIASDYAMYQKYGSIAQVENHNIGVMNNVQTNYNGVFAVDFTLNIVTQYIVSTSGGDPWTASTDPDPLLTSFQNWAQNNGFGTSNYDIGELWSNRNFDGSTIGLAYTQAICTGWRYHVLQDFSNNAAFLRVLVAHEMGHNFNALHDASNSGFIMAPAVSTSTTWSATSVSDIDAFTAPLLGGCLSSCATAASPSVNFTASPTNVCAGSTVQFTDLSSDNPTAWDWTFPGGTPSSSTDQNPIVTYATPGIYDVTLTASNATGSGTGTIQNYITVSANNPSFSASAAGLTASFTNETFPEADSYLWDFGDPGSGVNNTSTLVNPQHTYPADGVYLITLTASNACGSSTFNLSLSLNTPAIANFTASPTTVCSGEAVQFTSTSSANTTQWNWTFPGGTPATSTEENPTVVYNSIGSYNASLQAISPGGSDSETKNNYITVIQSAIPEFTWSAPSGNTVTFTNTTSPLSGNTYSWDFGDGSSASTDIHPSHTFPSSGSYTVILSVITPNCGTKTISHTIQLQNAPAANFSGTPTSGCSPLTVQFTDLSTNTPTAWSWSFPGGSPSSSTSQNPSITYANPGNYTVILTASNGAGSTTKTIADYISVASAPTASFSKNQTGNSVAFTNTSTGNATSYTWDFGDSSANSTETNPTHVYTTDGTYTVTLTATNACGSHSITAQVIITANTPTVSITVAPSNTVCIGQTVNFTANVSANTQNVSWTFADGTPATSTSMNPSVTFSTVGDHLVTLTAFNGSNSASANTTITAQPNTVASFASGTNGLTANFTNTSTTATSYSWDFGDSSSSTQENPSHTYTADGTYDVCLTVTGPCGTDTTCSSVIISGNGPTASIQASTASGCQPLTINYHADVSANTSSVQWTFGGGMPATSTLIDQAVVYNNAGTYLTTLAATNPSGSSTDNLQVTVFATTSASFTSSTNGPTVSFTSTSTGSPTSYLWDFGDSSSSSDQNPTHDYSAAGNYTACLTTTNSCGSSTACHNIVIADFLPTASIETTGSTTGCEPMTVNFHANITNASSVAWTFSGGNPSTSSDLNPTVVFNTPGTHTVTLSATNGNGTTSATPESIVVNPRPTANFTVNVSGHLVTTTNISQNGTSYIWDFGDGTIIESNNPGHLYAVDTVTKIQLIATNTCGSDTMSMQVTIGAAPSVNPVASVSSGCSPLTVTFLANAQNSQDINWTFPTGSPTSSTSATPTVVFTTPGIHTATVSATNTLGTATQEVQVIVLPETVAGFNATINGNTVTFTSTSQNGISSLWLFGDNTSAQNVSNAEHTYGTGTFTAVLIVTGACNNDTTYQNFTFGSALAVNPVANVSSGCAPLSVNFQANAQSAESISWTFPTGNPTSSTDANPTVVFDTPGTHVATVTASNTTGFVTDTVQIVVMPETVANFNYTVNDHTVTFTNNSQNGTSYTWVFGDNTTAQDISPVEHTFADGEFTAQLIVTGACSTDTSSQNFIFGAMVPPEANIQSNGVEGCAPYDVTYEAQLTNNTESFVWNFPGGNPLTSTDANVTVTYNNAGQYVGKLIATNQYGSDTALQTIVVHPLAIADFTFTVSGLELTTTNTSTNADTYFWTFGDGGSSSLENPVHVYPGNGNYDIVLKVTNFCGNNEMSRNLFIVDIEDPLGEVNVKLFPNPNNGIFTLDVQSIQPEEVDITIFDLLGRKVLQRHWSKTQKINEDIHFEDQPAGNYIFQLKYQDRLLTGKLIKM